MMKQNHEGYFLTNFGIDSPSSYRYKCATHSLSPSHYFQTADNLYKLVHIVKFSNARPFYCSELNVFAICIMILHNLHTIIAYVSMCAFLSSISMYDAIE